jgi:hypothetical protein
LTVAVFVYGSLVSRTSAAETIGRPDAPSRPATLTGWRRGFTLVRDNRACEKTFARSDDDTVPDHILALNVDRGSAPDIVNGALIAVTEAEIVRLDRREIRYERVEIDAGLGGAQDFERVFTYVARSEHHATSPPPGAVVLNSYERAVEDAFAEHGPGELGRYRETTDRGPAERIDAYLLSGEIPPGNPRGW